jgi:PAS domain S-box-containing protein
MSAPFDRFAAVVASSDDAIVTKAPDGAITSWNRAATRLFGYDPDDAIGRSVTMLFPRERLAEEAEFIARIARGERVEHFETQRIRKNGSLVDASITLSPIIDAQGRIVEISKIGTRPNRTSPTGRNPTNQSTHVTFTRAMSFSMAWARRLGASAVRNAELVTHIAANDVHIR